MSYQIKCEVLSVDGERHCTGGAQVESDQAYIIGVKTPEPEGMCAKSFAALFPLVTAMRFSDEVPPWEKGRGYYEAYCPDGKVKYRLSRIRQS